MIGHRNTGDVKYDETAPVMKWASILPGEQRMRARVPPGAEVLIATKHPSTVKYTSNK